MNSRTTRRFRELLAALPSHSLQRMGPTRFGYNHFGLPAGPLSEETYR